MIRKAKLWSADQAVQQAQAIERAMQQAARQVLIDHKRSGDPIVVSENGTVRWIPAEEIEIPDLPEDST